MDELRVEFPPGRLVGTVIAAEHNDSVAGVEKLVGDRGETVPFGAEPGEHPGQDRLRPQIGIAVRIREILRLVPDDVRAHPADHAGHVAGLERGIEALHQSDIVL